MSSIPSSTSRHTTPSNSASQILEAIRYVDEVIPEHTWDQKVQDVKAHDIDIFVMGHDWEGEFDFLKEYCEVIYLPRTEGVSTTKTKQDLSKRHD